MAVELGRVETGAPRSAGRRATLPSRRRMTPGCCAERIRRSIVSQSGNVATTVGSLFKRAGCSTCRCATASPGFFSLSLSLYLSPFLPLHSPIILFFANLSLFLVFLLLRLLALSVSLSAFAFGILPIRLTLSKGSFLMECMVIVKSYVKRFTTVKQLSLAIVLVAINTWCRIYKRARR